MDEEQVKKIAKQAFDDSIAEYAEKNKYGISDVPAHVHNGVDVAHVSMFNMDDIPVTTKGDIFTFGTNIAKLPVGTDGQYLVADSTQNTGLKYQTLPASQVDYTSSTFTAFENIADRDAVALSSNSATDTVSNGGTPATFDVLDWTGVTMTVNSGVRLISMTANLLDNNNVSGTAYVYRTSGGVPTGSPLDSKNYTVGNSGGNYGFSWTFATPISTTQGEVFAFVFNCNSSLIGGMLKYQATGTGVTGNQYIKSATGSSYTQTTSLTASQMVTDFGGISGQLLKASAKNNNLLLTSFVGFAVGAIAARQTGYVATSGILTGFSPQKVNGSTYYLQDTLGTIGTSPGTNSRKIGMGAKSGILIKNDNV